MGVWQKFKSIFAARKTEPNEPAYRHLMVPLRVAGELVDHDTALKVSAFFRGVSYISQTVAQLPWHVMEEKNERRRKLDNDVSRLLHERFNPELSAMAGKQTMLAWALTWGNGYAEIQRDSYGTPMALWPIAPHRVVIRRRADTKEIVYEVWNKDGYDYIPYREMFHLYGLGYDGVQGYSIVSLAAKTLGLALAAEDTGSDFYRSDMIGVGYFSHPGKLSPEARQRLREGITPALQTVGSRWNPPVLEEGIEWKGMTIPSKDAQMLESRQFQVAEIARWLGLPPHKLADLSRSTFSNIEHQNIEVVNDALMPWIIRYEQEANFKLLGGPKRSKIYSKINVSGLLRGDDKSRAEYYKIMREIGVYCINDILRLEDMDPIGPEGDERILQLNQTTLKKLVADEPQPEPTEDNLLEDTKASYFRLFVEAQKRNLNREINHFRKKWAHLVENPEDFGVWADNFFIKHREYMHNSLGPTAEHFAMSVSPGMAANGQLHKIIDAHIDRQVETSRLILSMALNSKNEDFEAEFSPETAAKALLEAIVIGLTTG
jgi:HK97 family phage portal protein